MPERAFDFLLGEEQALIVSSVAEFARDVVSPRMEAIEHAGTFPEELRGEIAGLGLFGVFVPAEKGGAGAGFSGHAGLVEALGRAGGIAGILPVAQGIVTDAVLRSGNPKAAALLEGLAAGTLLSAPALAEDDLSRIATRAEGEGSEVRLTGTKVMVPYAARAEVFVVLAQRGSEDVLALVDAKAAGVGIGGVEPLLGFTGLEAATLSLTAAAGTILGGTSLVKEILSGARIAVAALLAGIGRGALDHAARYADERKQFGLPLKSFAALQERLARADAAVEAARGLVLAAARARDRGESCEVVARQARLLAAEAALGAADDAVQIYGGYGYSREYPVERCYRDAAFVGFGEFHPTESYRSLAAALDLAHG